MFESFKYGVKCNTRFVKWTMIQISGVPDLMSVTCPWILTKIKGAQPAPGIL